MKLMKRLLLWLALIPLLLFITGLLLHPYLAITEPSGSDTAVVEGWIPPEMMPQVKAEIERRGYQRIYTTGTIRPFAYWLRKSDAITVDLEAAMEGGVRVVAAGVPGVQMMAIVEDDTLFVRPLNSDTISYWLQPVGPFQKLRMIPIATGAPDDIDVLFIKELTIRGTSAHALNASIAIEHGDGSRDPGSPTYAHLAAWALRRSGLVDPEVIETPAVIGNGGRTRANAEAFASRAIGDGITSVDIISMGVHARRSRKMFQNALGGHVKVGVISIPDPHALPGSWWRTSIGWSRLLKELAGMPIAAAGTDGR